MAAWLIVLGVIVLAIAYVFYNYFRIRRMGEGTAEMMEMAEIIRSGAATFLKTEYRTISIVVLLVALVFSLFIEKTSGITFLIGACMSSAVCVLGMRSATYANVRTANRARETLSIGETVKVALCGGSISGLSVQAFGMLGLVLVLVIWKGIDPAATGRGLLANLPCNPSIMRVTTYSLGCSLVAMFNRVAGGNYTKAADISSDILAKLRHDTAARHPELFKSLVTWAGAPDLSDMLTDELYEEAKKNGFFVMTFDWRDSLNVSLQWCDDVANTDVLAEFAEGYTGPVLAIHGKEDTTVDPEWSNKIVAASKNEASKTYFIEGMDHTFNVFSEEDFHSLYNAVDATGEFFKATLAD